MQYSRHAYEIHAYLPTSFAVTVFVYTLISTVYLKSAVAGTDHRIHTAEEEWYRRSITCFVHAEAH